MAVAVTGREVGHSFGPVATIDGLDLEVGAGRSVALVGPSGCGKSTTLEILAGLRDQDRGTVEVDGAGEARARLERCAYMPQRDCLLPWYSAIDNASIALRNRGATAARARQEAARLFEHFGLAGFERSMPAQLSGGMRQRVAFLRTLLSGKPVLLLDEPFASLDAITRAELQSWLAGVLEQTPRTVVLVTHDIEEALFLADSVLVLSPRPARVLERASAPRAAGAPRHRVVTDPAFVAVREEVMAVLGGGGL